MADVHGKITFKPLTKPLCWKHPKSFKLGLEEPWESERSSNCDADEVSLTTMSCQLTL